MCDARDQNGTKLISVDPRFTVTCAQSDDWVPIRPGADTALIDGIINYVMQNGLYDADYIRKNTVGPYLVDPRHVASGYEPRPSSGRQGRLRRVRRVGQETSRPRAIRRSRRPPSWERHAAGGLNKHPPPCSRLLTWLPSTRPNTPRSSPTCRRPRWSNWQAVGIVQATCCQGRLRAFALVPRRLAHAGAVDLAGDHGQHRRARRGVTTFAGGITTSAFDFFDFWAPKGTKLYTLLEPMDFCDAVEKAKPFPVKAAWFMIDNFAQQMSDRNRGDRGDEASSSSSWSPTTSFRPRLILPMSCLPACTYFEKTDLLSSNNFYLQYMPKIIDPLFESKSDLDAISMVAEKMGVGQYFNETPEDYLKQMHEDRPTRRRPDGEGADLGTAHDRHAVHLNTDPMPYVPFFNQQYPTKSGKIEFYVEMLVPFDQELCDHKEPMEASPTNPLFQKYPLVFLSTHTRFRTHSQYVNLPWLKEINNGGDGFLEINPRDAAPRGIADGDVVRIFNDRGEMKVRARLTESMKPGVVNCYQGGWDTIRVKHYIEGHPNNLTHQIAKPAQALIPNFPSNAAYYDCLVQVEQCRSVIDMAARRHRRCAPRDGDRHEPLRRLLDLCGGVQGDQQRAAWLTGGTGSSRPRPTSRRARQRPRATTSTSRAGPTRTSSWPTFPSPASSATTPRASRSARYRRPSAATTAPCLSTTSAASAAVTAWRRARTACASSTGAMYVYAAGRCRRLRQGVPDRTAVSCSRPSARRAWSKSAPSASSASTSANCPSASRAARSGARIFGDLNDPGSRSEPARQSRRRRAAPPRARHRPERLLPPGAQARAGRVLRRTAMATTIAALPVAPASRTVRTICGTVLRTGSSVVRGSGALAGARRGSTSCTDGLQRPACATSSPGGCTSSPSRSSSACRPAA